MSTTFVDEGVVLRRVNYGDADRILTILTREHGKVGVIARGVRKPRARMAAQTDLFARAKMQLASGRGELLTLTQAERLDAVAPSANGVRMACCALIAELADRVLEANHPDEGMFELVTDALTAVLAAPLSPCVPVVWCVRLVIDRLGYAPELMVCVGCQTVLPEANAWFSVSGGGLTCESCSRHDVGAVPCTPRVIKVLRCIQRRDGDTYARLRLDDETVMTLLDLVERELAYHLDRRLRSMDVLRAML